MSERTALWIYIVLAVLNFTLQDWPLFRPIIFWSWRAIRWTVITVWHWSATWSWEAVCSIGWLGMVTVNEYAIGLCFLAAAALGALSKLVHWKPDRDRPFAKALGVTAIGVGFVLATLVTIANKGDRSWSPMLNLIDSRIAMRIPLPSLPPSPSPPTAPRVFHTSKAEWTAIAAAQKELEAARQKAPASTQPQPPQIIQDAEIAVGLAVTSDINVSNIPMDHDMTGKTMPDFRCIGLPCHDEEYLKRTLTEIPLSDKNEARLLFIVEDISITSIPHPIVSLSVDPHSVVNANAISLYANGERGIDHPYAELPGANAVEILPYKRSLIGYLYLFDIKVSDSSVTEFRLVATIVAANLPMHAVGISCRVKRFGR
ncbi:MAG TPA: hypothetical protein VE377_15270 [Candidatus Dormibacteraeota bacterium]|nr:hypothetical protein [Candidatus Dormibacteraeota bacterium]